MQFSMLNDATWKVPRSTWEHVGEVQSWEGRESFLVGVMIQEIVGMRVKGILSRGDRKCKYRAFGLVCKDRGDYAKR